MKKQRIAIGTAIVAVLALLLDAFLRIAGDQLQKQEEIDAQNNPIVVETPETPDESTEPLTSAVVTRVIDGDTLAVRIGETEETIRLIGLNAPETVDPNKGVECYGPEASAALKNELNAGDAVTLIVDASQDNRDKYNRLLRYVEEGSQDIGLWLIQNGYAKEHTYDGTFAREDEYKKAEDHAQEGNLGLWSDACSTSSVEE